MVRQRHREREDGLVEWVVRGKPRRTRWTRLDVSLGQKVFPETGRVPEGAVKARDTTSKTSDVPAGRKGGGKVDGGQVDVEAAG